MYFRIINKLRKQKTTFLPGFSLIELSIVMIIIGILMAAVFKGQDLLESARLQATLSDMNRYRLAILSYQDQFSHLPGNDSNAQPRFGGNARNGDGRGIIQASEAPQVWQHLFQAKLIEFESAPLARIGGYISVLSNPRSSFTGNYLVLSKSPTTLQAALTPHQAMLFKTKAGESKPTSGIYIVAEGEGASPDSCVRDGDYNLANKSASCIILMAF